MKWILALVLLSACATTTQYARWPYRGPMLEITNLTTERVVVFSRDGQGREIRSATVNPGARSCFRWPFIHSEGTLIATSQGVQREHPVRSDTFAPWSADGWSWAIPAVLPVANPQACR